MVIIYVLLRGVKISEANKNKPSKRKGIPLTEEHKQKLRDAIAKNPSNHKIPNNKGRIHTIEQNKNHSETMKGRKKVWDIIEERYRMIK